MEPCALGTKMILESIKIPDMSGVILSTMHLDTIDRCLDRQHYLSYPYTVNYQFNSRGFRDREWPNDLHGSIWCIGDSFTIGMGAPIEHSWPWLLEQLVGIRCINVSMDGASNDWIARHAVKVLTEIRPRYLCIMWTYLHRRENKHQGIDDRERRLHYTFSTYQEDLQNFLDNYNLILENQGKTHITMAVIPYAFIDPMQSVFDLWHKISDQSWPRTPLTMQEIDSLPANIVTEIKSVHGCWEWFLDLQKYRADFMTTVPDQSLLLRFPKGIYEVVQLDKTRDGHHFDIKTSQSVAAQMMNDLGL